MCFCIQLSNIEGVQCVARLHFFYLNLLSSYGCSRFCSISDLTRIILDIYGIRHTGIQVWSTFCMDNFTFCGGICCFHLVSDTGNIPPANFLSTSFKFFKKTIAVRQFIISLSSAVTRFVPPHLGGLGRRWMRTMVFIIFIKLLFIFCSGGPSLGRP